jgi:HK97 family phage prohead protease
MNIIKRIIKRIKKENPYTEKHLDNADLIIAGNEKLNREQIKERFDSWYKVKDKKHWETDIKDYNNMRKEKRNITFKNLNSRSTEKEGKKYIEGIIPYDSKSVPMWGTVEIIDRTAFNKTLKDKKEVRAFWNHDDSKVLGNTKSGTLELNNSDEGLICRCELPNTSYANDLWEIVTRGDVKNMSFGFVPIQWEDSDSGKLRTLKEVRLEEVSFGVTFPAYPETNSQTYIRNIFMKRKIDIENIISVLEKEELTEEDLTVLQEAVDSLNKIINENKPQEKEDEAARAEPPKQDTPDNADTLKETQEEDDKEKEAIKQEIIDLIDTLFEIEKENLKEETNE